MKAILINVFNRTVSEVDYDGNLDTLYKMLGCECFTVAYPTEERKGDGVYVDDEGLINGQQLFFSLGELFPQPYAGNGLIVGCNEEGDTIAPQSITLEEVAKVVKFHTLTELKRMYA